MNIGPVGVRQDMLTVIADPFAIGRALFPDPDPLGFLAGG